MTERVRSDIMPGHLDNVGGDHLVVLLPVDQFWPFFILLFFSAGDKPKQLFNRFLIITFRHFFKLGIEQGQAHIDLYKLVFAAIKSGNDVQDIPVIGVDCIFFSTNFKIDRECPSHLFLASCTAFCASIFA